MSLLETTTTKLRGRIHFDRNEFSGAFGDIGTDLPLIVGMLLVSGMDSASVLISFGALQVFTALTYGIPMPVQPLKAVAALVIAQHISGNIIIGGGLSIGIVMIMLTVTGSLDLLARLVPLVVVRGIQFGLGLQLASVALTRYVQSDGIEGYVLAAIAFALIISLLGNRRFPPALPVIGVGLVYTIFFRSEASVFASSFGVALPRFQVPTTTDIIDGFLLLALPQIPLSLGNSLLATERIAHDFFPSRAISLRKLGFTYSLMNMIAPFWGGIPVCHGSGGLAGHYLFGARTGGSIVIYGGMYIVLGLFFSQGFAQLTHVFPLPILGVILMFESIALMKLIKDTTDSGMDFSIALIVGLLSFAVPSGYLVGMVVGVVLTLLKDRLKFG
jgi:hypothetical protein